MPPERAASSFVPEKIWDEQVRGRRALWTEWRLTWMGFRRWLGGEPAPTVDPIVADRLRVAQMALDVAHLLKLNSRHANNDILGNAEFLLDCVPPAPDDEDEA